MDASVSALETVTLPSVTMDTDTGEVVVSDKRRTKLKLDSSPVSTTFAVFNSTTTTSPPCVIFTSLVETSSALSYYSRLSSWAFTGRSW